MTVTHGQLTGLSVAQALTVPAGATTVLLQAKTQNIYYTMDGSTPSATNGLILLVGLAPISYSGKLSGLKFLEVTASAVLNYAFFVDRTTA